MSDSFTAKDAVGTVGAGNVRLRYCMRGSGHPLLLVHGVGATLEAWNGVVEHLAAPVQIIRYDLRGNGESGRPAGPYSIDDFVTDAERVLDHLQIERCHVAGHSLGGMIALAFAARRPERVDKLIVLSAAVGRTEEERAQVLARVDTIANGIPGEHFRRSLDRWFTEEFQHANPGIIDLIAERNLRNDPTCYAASYRVLATTELAPELESIRAPTLIATGIGDIGSNPRMAKFMHSRIAGSELRILQGLRHSILIEAPAVVAALISDFLQGGSSKEELGS